MIAIHKRRLTPPRRPREPRRREGRGMGTVTVKIWSVTWRGGRPRFNPGPKLRRLGYRGEDLRHADGRWFTLDEAGAWAQARQTDAQARAAAKAAGKRPRHPEAPRRGLSVADLAALWYEAPAFKGGTTRGRRVEAGLKPATVRDYKGKLRVLFVFAPDIADAPPAAVSEQVAQGLYERLWEGKGIHMAGGIVAVASALWTWGAGRGLAGLTRAHNPWRAVERTTPPPRVVILEDFEVAAWIAACDLADADGIARPELGDAIMLGLFTGQRQGDRLSLAAAGRDDNGRRLFRQGKTGAIVAIPEAPALALRLEAAAARRKAAGIVDAQVILDERQRAPFKADHYRHLIAARRALAVAGVPQPHPGNGWLVAPCPSLAGKRDQDLRDTAVTWLARAGATAYEIAAITGHSLGSIHGVLRHYLALHPDMADKAIGKLVAWMTEKGMAV